MDAADPARREDPDPRRVRRDHRRRDGRRGPAAAGERGRERRASRLPDRARPAPSRAPRGRRRSSPTSIRPSWIATVAGTAPLSRTAASDARATARFCGIRQAVADQRRLEGDDGRPAAHAPRATSAATASQRPITGSAPGRGFASWRAAARCAARTARRRPAGRRRASPAGARARRRGTRRRTRRRRRSCRRPRRPRVATSNVSRDSPSRARTVAPARPCLITTSGGEVRRPLRYAAAEERLGLGPRREEDVRRRVADERAPPRAGRGPAAARPTRGRGSRARPRRARARSPAGPPARAARRAASRPAGGAGRPGTSTPRGPPAPAGPRPPGRRRTTARRRARRRTPIRPVRSPGDAGRADADPVALDARRRAPVRTRRGPTAQTSVVRAPSRASQRAVVAAEPPWRRATRPGHVGRRSRAARAGTTTASSTRSPRTTTRGGAGRDAAAAADGKRPGARPEDTRGRARRRGRSRPTPATCGAASTRARPAYEMQSAMTTATRDPRPARDRHDPDPLDRRRPEGELRPSGRPDGRGADGLHALDALPAPRPDPPGLAGPRPVRPERRPRLDAPVLAPPPDRLRRDARGPRELPAVGLADAGPPGVRPDAGRRGDDRAARPGLRERRRHGDRRGPPRAPSSTATATTSSTTGRTRSARTATSRRASPRRPPASPAISACGSSSPSTTTTTSSSTGRPRWPGRRTSSPGSRPTAGTPTRVEDGNDIEAIAAAIEEARADDRPSLIAVRTHIGFGSPNRQDTQKAHGQPLGADEVRLVKEAYGWDPGQDVLRAARGARAVPAGDPGRRGPRRGVGAARSTRYAAAYPDLAAAFRRRVIDRRLPDGWDGGLKTYAVGEEVATRNASQDVDPGAGEAAAPSCSAARPTCPSRT